MDMFVRFNRKRIDDRQIDTLIGLSKGIVADDHVSQAEAEFLANWLVQNRQATDNPIVVNLLEKVNEMLEDGILDEEESVELLGLLHQLSGEPSEFGELSKTATLPVDNPMPDIAFEGSTFLFTGTCAYGARKHCHAETEQRGGINATSVSKSLDYLILGSYVTDSWAHESYGRKIEKAMQYRDEGVPLAIVTEEHWANCGKIE